MKVRIGIMSNAHVHAALYIPGLQSAAAVDLVGLADDEIDRAREAEAQFGIRVFESYDELLAQQLDGVIISSENTRHRQHVEMAIRAGVPTLLCEKPMTTTVADATAIVDLCAVHGTQLMVAFPMRYSDPMRSARDLLMRGELGDAVAFEGVNQGKIPADRRAWFVRPELVGGGAITDHTVHVLDAVRWLLGEEPIEIYAQSNDIIGDLDQGLETSGLVVAEFEGGAILTIDSSWNRPKGYPAWGGLAISIMATGGSIDVDAYAQRIPHYGAESGGNDWIDFGPNAYRAMLDHFIRCVQGAESVAPTVTDGLESVRAIEAAYESIRTGQPVLLARPRERDVPL